MNTPEIPGEGKGGTTFGLKPQGFVGSEAARRTGAPGIPVEPKKEGLGLGAKIGLAVLGVGALLGIGKCVQVGIQHDIIPIHRSSENPPGTFDPTALKGVTDENNTIVVANDKYDDVAPPLYKDNVLTIPLAVKFKGDQIRPLNIETSENSGTSTETVMTLNGLEEGDILISPIDGEIRIGYGAYALKTDGSLQNAAFFIRSTDGSEISYIYSTVGVKPLSFGPLTPTEKGMVTIPIKRGGEFGILTTSGKHPNFNGQVQIIGYAPLEKRLELATTSAGKAIVLK